MSQGRVVSSVTRTQDTAFCRAMIRGGSKSFYAASFLLPAKMRRDAYALYAFCRLSDDMVDVDGGAHRAVEQLRHRLDCAYAGAPEDSPIDRAFADVIARHGLPRTLPEALIEGLDWDTQGRVYESLSDVYAYGARVAGAVGAMMAVLMGVRDNARQARACDLGVAMQLTNIARDVGEDARNGRLYLPRQWLREEGIDPERWLGAPRFTPAIGRVVERLLAQADHLYRRSESGIAALPMAYRPAIFAARYLYAEIGAVIAKNGYDSINQRAVVPAPRKLALLGRAGAAAAWSAGAGHHISPLRETAYLVDAVARAPFPADSDPAAGIVRLLDLFAELETRERLRQSRA